MADPADEASNYFVCCRGVTGLLGLLFKHCHLQYGPCAAAEFGEKVTQYSVSHRSTGRLDNGKPCNCVSGTDINECAGTMNSPYAPAPPWEYIPPRIAQTGGATWGDNCQSSVLEVLAKCCLESNWSPDPYAGNPRGKCTKWHWEYVYSPSSPVAAKVKVCDEREWDRFLGFVPWISH